MNETFQSNLDGSLHSCAAQYRYRDVNVPVVINVGDTESVAGIVVAMAQPGAPPQQVVLVQPMQRLFYDIEMLKALTIEAINLVTKSGNSPRGQFSIN